MLCDCAYQHILCYTLKLQQRYTVRPFNPDRPFSELASQYRSVSEENPKVANFFEDTGRGDEMCSSPRVSAHWRLKHDWEVDGAPTVFQRVVKWQEPDAAAMVKRPTGVDLDVASDEKTEVEAHQTIRPSPCFTAVPRGRRPAELFDDKGSIPPVGFYNPRETLVATRTNVSTKFLYPKVGCPRTPLTREQIHEQYPLSRPASAAGSYKSRPATPGNLSATMQGDADGDATQILALDATEDIAAGVTDTAVRTTTGAKSRSRSPSPNGSWFFNKSDRIICAEPMYREVIVPKEEYNVDKGWAMLERHQPSVSLKVVGRDDMRQEQHDRIYPGAWADKRSVRGALPMGKTTGRDRPASGSSISAAVINSVEFVESLPFKSERARPASVDFKRLTGRNSPVITKLAIAAPQPMDVVYNPQLNFVRQRFATPVPFAKMPGRSPPRHFSATGAEERPMVYDSLKAFEFVATRSKSPGIAAIELVIFQFVEHRAV